MYADYDEIIERISVQALWDFPGGVHPPQQKELSNSTPIETLSLPDMFYVPIKQHIGTGGQILVNEGDYVLKGQALSANDLALSVPVHAPTSGTVTKIGEHVSAHPSGIGELTIYIKPDGLDKWTDLVPLKDYVNHPKHDLVNAICKAGISGLGGAGFPTHIKADEHREIEFLIINGVECEPYISSDDRLMREHAWQIRQGIDILVHLIKPKQVLVAIEDNKPVAIETLSVACQQQTKYQVVSIPTKYPAGGEKQLIQVLTSREIPTDGLPADVGCMMFNVATCFAISDAIMEGKPLVERIVTLTGDAFDAPKNVWARLGTPISHLLSAGAYSTSKQESPRVIMGGPMMGFTVSSLETPVVKITNCLLAPADKELPTPEDERACIRCSACAEACPASLLPQQLFWYSKAKEYDTAQEYNLFDCIECGACAYVCPSEIPLVHYYRKAKADIRIQQEEKEKAEKARIRFEARQERLLKEKLEREEKHRKAAEARKQSMNKDGGAAKDKIAAALARAKAKKEALAQQKGENATVTTNASQESSQTSVTDNVELEAPNDKKDKVAAAIARAKAKKLAKAAAVSEDKKSDNEAVSLESKIVSSDGNDENTAQNVAEDEAVDSTENTVSESSTKKTSDKKAKVAAAIAKAKAKKLEKAKMNEQDNTQANTQNESKD
jgi:electron transport complex protein RnfC